MREITTGCYIRALTTIVSVQPLRLPPQAYYETLNKVSTFVGSQRKCSEPFILQPTSVFDCSTTTGA